MLMLAGLLTSGAAQAESALRAELLAGEVLSESRHTSESGGAARARALFHASAERVWETVLSCEAALVYVKGMVHCEVLEDSPERGIVHQVVDRSWLVPTQNYTFESLRNPHRGIRFQLLEGNLDILEGYWRFEPRPEGLLVEYEARVKPAFPVPDFLVRHVVRKDMPNLLACIRALANGSGSPEQERKDLAHCSRDFDPDKGDHQRQ